MRISRFVTPRSKSTPVARCASSPVRGGNLSPEKAEPTLSEYITAHLTKPFKWGENDCCIFAIEWLRLKSGHDYLKDHRPWKTAREASRKLRDLGGLSVLFDGNLTRINPNMAKDGDLTIYQNTAHLFSGRHIVSVGLDGLVFTERTAAKEAWTCRP